MTATAAFATTGQPLAQPNMQIALLLRFVDEIQELEALNYVFEVFEGQQLRSSE